MGRTTYSNISGCAPTLPIGSSVTMAQPHSFEPTLDAARRGDERAAERLYAAYQPMLLRYLRSQERGVAEDLAAEVWLAAARALPDFEGDERAAAQGAASPSRRSPRRGLSAPGLRRG